MYEKTLNAIWNKTKRVLAKLRFYSNLNMWKIQIITDPSKYWSQWDDDNLLVHPNVEYSLLFKFDVFQDFSCQLRKILNVKLSLLNIKILLI